MVQQAARTAATASAILESAQRLFAEQGFDAVSMDAIAASAGVAKGGVYHHFRSKKEIFEAVLDAVQAELAATIEARIAQNKGPRTPSTLATNVLAYLQAATRDDLRRLILVDGPVVMGWERWRQIDDRHFMASIRGAIEAFMPQGTQAAEVDSATKLVAGAVMEAALASGAADDPVATARLHCRMLEAMLRGLQRG